MAVLASSLSTDDRILEAISCPIVEGSLDDDNRRIKLDILVAGHGNARDSHIYKPALLEECARSGIFNGARMFANHLSRSQEAELDGLPRPIDQVVGVIDRTWVATRESDGKAVLRGDAEIVDDGVWSKVRRRPDLLGVSINGRGPSSPGEFEGRPGKVVESIRQVKSVDWVSFAGAGGGVHEIGGRRITEAAIVDDLDDELRSLIDVREAEDPVGRRGDGVEHRREEKKHRGRGKVRCPECGGEQTATGGEQKCLHCGKAISATREADRDAEPALEHDFREGDSVDVYQRGAGVVVGRTGPAHLQVQVGRGEYRVHHSRLQHEADLTETDLDLEGFTPMRTQDWLAEADAELEDELAEGELDDDGEFDDEFGEEGLEEGDWYPVTGSRGGEWIPRDDAELDREITRGQQPRTREARSQPGRRPAEDLFEAEYDDDDVDVESVECDVTYRHGETGRRHRRRDLSLEEARRHAQDLHHRGHRDVKVVEAEPVDVDVEDLEEASTFRKNDWRRGRTVLDHVRAKHPDASAARGPFRVSTINAGHLHGLSDQNLHDLHHHLSHSAHPAASGQAADHQSAGVVARELRRRGQNIREHRPDVEDLEEFSPEWEGEFGEEWHGHHDRISPDQDGWESGSVDTHMSRPPTTRVLYDPAMFTEADEDDDSEIIDDEPGMTEAELDYDAEYFEAEPVERGPARDHRKARRVAEQRRKMVARRHHGGRRKSEREEHERGRDNEHREALYDLEEPLEEFDPEWHAEPGPEWDGFQSDRFYGDPVDAHASRPPTDRVLHDPALFMEADEADSADPGIPFDDGMDADREIEERASQLANQRVAGAVEAARDEMRVESDRRLAENDARWRGKFEQRGQRDRAFAMIEASQLPINSQMELRREFADVLMEADTDHDGVETQSAENKLAERVKDAIDAKKRELTGVIEAGFQHGESTVASASPIASRTAPPARRPAVHRDADQQVDAAIGIPSTSATQGS